jgi:glycosyltransferase involved in cell wall biosynthesis
MKILLANYRYFISGGPERYLFNVTQGLTARGHTVIPFSIRYARNEPTPYARYFVAPLAGEEQVYFREHPHTPTALWRTLVRLFYAPEVAQAASRLVVGTQPQVAYVLNYLRKLSPALLVGLKRAGLPVVVRLSDYAMLCPQAHCLRDGRPCELCVTGQLWSSVRHRCLQGSLVASTLNAAATTYHRLAGYFDLIDAFVVTNRFMYDMLLKVGFSADRLVEIPTFVDGDRFRPAPEGAADNYWIYVGRLEPAKGVHILIEALARLAQRRPHELPQTVVVGGGNEKYRAELQRQAQEAGLAPRITFTGEVATDRLLTLLASASLSIIPSLWYENLPNALLESYACGVPVVASGIGSLYECVEDGRTGHLFRTGDPADLAATLERCLDDRPALTAMGRQARAVALSRYHPTQHLQKLEELFERLLK